MDKEPPVTGRQAAMLGGTHLKTCHHCGNIRRELFFCTACPQVFCHTCCIKLKGHDGINVFVGGCVVCKGLCCCAHKTRECIRTAHCYKKCPTTRAGKGYKVVPGGGVVLVTGSSGGSNSNSNSNSNSGSGSAVRKPGAPRSQNSPPSGAPGFGGSGSGGGSINGGSQQYQPQSKRTRRGGLDGLGDGADSPRCYQHGGGGGGGGGGAVLGAAHSLALKPADVLPGVPAAVWHWLHSSGGSAPLAGAGAGAGAGMGAGKRGRGGDNSGAGAGGRAGAGAGAGRRFNNGRSLGPRANSLKSRAARRAADSGGEEEDEEEEDEGEGESEGEGEGEGEGESEGEGEGQGDSGGDDDEEEEDEEDFFKDGDEEEEEDGQGQTFSPADTTSVAAAASASASVAAQ